MGVAAHLGDELSGNARAEFALAGEQGAIAILFDWNGTVVLDAERARASLNRVLLSRGLATLDRSAFSREFHLPMAEMFIRLGAADPGEAETEWNFHMRSTETVARAGAEVLEVLHAAGYRLGVVSAAFQAAVESDMNHLGLETGWASVDAPATDKVSVLRNRRGAEPLAYYVGDTVYDMTSALAAGFIPIAVAGGYTERSALEAAGAAHVIESLDELPAIVGLSNGR